MTMNVKKFLKSRGWSPKYLALMLRVSVRTVYRWMEGRPVGHMWAEVILTRWPSAAKYLLERRPS